MPRRARKSSSVSSSSRPSSSAEQKTPSPSTEETQRTEDEDPRAVFWNQVNFCNAYSYYDAVQYSNSTGPSFVNQWGPSFANLEEDSPLTDSSDANESPAEDTDDEVPPLVQTPAMNVEDEMAPPLVQQPAMDDSEVPLSHGDEEVDPLPEAPAEGNPETVDGGKKGKKKKRSKYKRT